MERTEDQMLATLANISKIIKQHEEVIHVHFCSDEESRLRSLLSHYQHQAAKTTAVKKHIIEDTLVYFRSIVMIAEMVGMAGTHREKEARLRGLIEHLNHQIEKLRKEQVGDIISSWDSYTWGGMSDYPYRHILSQFDQLKQENEQLKRELNPKQSSEDEMPY